MRVESNAGLLTTAVSFFALALLCMCASNLRAQTGNNLSTLEEVAKKVATARGVNTDEAVRTILSVRHRDRPRDIERIFNSISASFAGETRLDQLLHGLNLAPVVLDSTADSDGAIIGLRYFYKRQFSKNYSQPNSTKYRGIALDLAASGTIATDADKNPENFLNFESSLLGFFSIGGVSSVSSDELADRLNALEDAMARIEDPDELLQSTEARDFDNLVMGSLSDQYYLEFSAHGGLDADQNFDSYQWYAGGHLTFAPRGWNTYSLLSMINVLDYVPALFRYLTNADYEWTPRGSALPTFIAAVEQVLPNGDNPRTLLAGSDDEFTRFRGEIVFRTAFGEFLGDTVLFEAALRYYYELDADIAVKSAGLNEFTYFTTALLLPQNIYFSYSSGKLPFDAEDDQVFKLGFQTSF